MLKRLWGTQRMPSGNLRVQSTGPSAEEGTIQSPRGVYLGSVSYLLDAFASQLNYSLYQRKVSFFLPSLQVKK